jgi:hypothetical protein
MYKQSNQNRRASNALSPVFIHFVAPHGKLLQRLLALEQLLGSLPPLLTSQQTLGPHEPHYGITPEEWPNVVHRVVENHESLRRVATGDARVPQNRQTDPSYFSPPQSRINRSHFPQAVFEDACVKCDQVMLKLSAHHIFV